MCVFQRFSSGVTLGRDGSVGGALFFFTVCRGEVAFSASFLNCRGCYLVCWLSGRRRRGEVCRYYDKGVQFGRD